MDTFMDQLSQKMNAQQIIRANGEAESEAMGVMRAQVREYQDCLDRMKSVADELGGLKATIAALPDLGQGVDDAALDDLKSQMESMNKANEEYLQQMQNDLLASQNDFIARQKDLAESQNDLMSRQSAMIESQNDLMSRQSAMLESRSNELKEQIESIRVSNEEHLERLRNDIADSGNDDLNQRFDRLEAQIGNQLGDLQQGVSAQIAQVRAANEEFQTKIREELSAMQGELTKPAGDDAVYELIQALQDDVASLKLQTENIRNANDQYLQQMQSNLRKGQEQMLDSQKSLSQALGNADIHKECVRVYRNVQASIQDENAKQLESIKQENAAQLESIKTDGARNITVIKDESAKLLGSLRNDSGKQLENIREENSKLMVNVRTDISKVDEDIKGVKKLAVIAIIASILSIVAPFTAYFLF